ncbi:glutamyl-tRNA reductase [uncultured Helicobacter sp.]|uniref:glutamyl-tRNA reductase n=1 Tax=uncultured Helicobacter sp. TaxID=175537 RepID=UPI0037524EDC
MQEHREIQYIVVSFSHRHIDIAMREKLAFGEEERLAFLRALCEHSAIKEAMLLSTCNRVEVYASVLEAKAARECILQNLESFKQIPLEQLRSLANIRLNQYAIYHTFSVASSLDSLVVGETQITGQLKDAYRFAYENLLCGKDLTRLVHYAFRCAAQVRNSVDISSSHTSVAGAAVHMLTLRLKERGESLDSKQVAVLGAGEMGVLALKHLAKHDVRLTLINRNIQNAQKMLENLTEEIGRKVEIAPFSQLQGIIDRADVLVSATGAPHSVISAEMIRPSTHRRVWFDLAVPRDIEEVQVENLEIYRIDDLQEIIAQTKLQREENAKDGYKIVEQCTQEFFKWLQTLSVDPIIKHMRALAKDSSLKELDRAIKKGFLPSEYRHNVEKILHSAFNTFLHKPTMRIKEAGESINSDPMIEAIKSIFDINDEIVMLNKYKCEEYLARSQNTKNPKEP